MSLTKEEIEKICAEENVVKLYHLWLPKEVYETVCRLAKIKQKSMNTIIVDCVRRGLGIGA